MLYIYDSAHWFASCVYHWIVTLAHSHCKRSSIQLLPTLTLNDRTQAARDACTRSVDSFHTSRTDVKTAVETAWSIPDYRRINSQTVRNYLLEIDLRAGRPALRPSLTPQHRQSTLQWCRQHVRHVPARWWRNVLFSDESRFHPIQSDGRQRVYRRLRCRQTVRRRVSDGVVSLNAPGNRNQILQPVTRSVTDPGSHFSRSMLVPILLGWRPFMDANNFHVDPWPTISPYLTPIGHVWDEMDLRLRRQQRQPQTVDEMARDLGGDFASILCSSVNFNETGMHRNHRRSWWTHPLLYELANLHFDRFFVNDLETTLATWLE